MKYINKISLFFIGIAMIMSSCADYKSQEFDVTKPASIEGMEYLNKYDALKTYIDRAANPNFKLGAGVSLSDYNSKGVMYRLITSNYDEITLGNEMKNESVVQADGSLSYGNIPSLLQEAKDAGITVYGHTLVWHAQQRAKYYNSLIAPTVIPGTGGPSFFPSDITNSTFDTGISGWGGWGLQSTRTWAQGEGPNGTNALKWNNTQAGQSWEAQVAVDFPTALIEGEKYVLKFQVKSSVAATVSANLQDPSNYAGRGDFGSFPVTTAWTQDSLTTTVNGANAKRFLFNFGNVAGTIWLANVTLSRVNTAGGGGTTWKELVTNGNFATNDLTTSFFFTSNANPQLVNDATKGQVMKIASPTILTNDWDMQFWVLINPPAKLNEKYKFSMDVRSDADCSFPTQSHYKPQDYIFYDMVGSIKSTTAWSTYKYDLTIDANRIGNRDGIGSIAFNLGKIATTVYIKNVSLTKEVQTTGDQIIEKTPEEKKTILTGALETWIKGIKGVSTYVKAWDVVNEPMSDYPDPTKLKTGVGNANLAANEFYWQDYLGKDYAATAIKLARQNGNPDDKLFINDYGLEGNLTKCQGLIDFVKYTDDACKTLGVKGVDGIGTQMHISLDVNKDNIVQMFKLLAATGKLIKISELDMGLGGSPAITTPNATNDQYLKQAELYRFVVEQYFANIPAAQRYGITQWAVTDSPAGSGWRPNEPIGLWTISLSRKHAYGGFANGLAGKDVSATFK